MFQVIVIIRKWPLYTSVLFGRGEYNNVVGIIPEDGMSAIWKQDWCQYFAYESLSIVIIILIGT